MIRTITVGNCSFNVEPGAHKPFWNRVSRGQWEPETFAIFDKHIGQDTLFVDVGAWIGSTALYGAQRAGHCVAFEPNPTAFLELKRNVAANAGADWFDRLEIHECAINKDGTSFTLGSSRDGANSMSSALFPERDNQWAVRAQRLQDVLSSHRRPGQPVFLKIDIEGGEYDLLPTLGDVIADQTTTIYISFHPRMLQLSLSETCPGDSWEGPFVDRHLLVLDSIPATRNLALADGTPTTKAALTQRLKRRLRFPSEILITGP